MLDKDVSELLESCVIVTCQLSNVLKVIGSVSEGQEINCGADGVLINLPTGVGVKASLAELRLSVHDGRVQLVALNGRNDFRVNGKCFTEAFGGDKIQVVSRRVVFGIHVILTSHHRSDGEINQR